MQVNRYEENVCSCDLSERRTTRTARRILPCRSRRRAEPPSARGGKRQRASGASAGAAVERPPAGRKRQGGSGKLLRGAQAHRNHIGRRRQTRPCGRRSQPMCKRSDALGRYDDRVGVHIHRATTVARARGIVLDGTRELRDFARVDVIVPMAGACMARQAFA